MTIHFEKGIPTAVDGKEMGAVELVEHLNKLGGENGIGLLDIVENRLVGMKSRGVYETPAVPSCTRPSMCWRPSLWIRRALTSRLSWPRSMPISSTTASGSPRCARLWMPLPTVWKKTVTGDVKLKLYKGNMINAGVTSPYTLYDEQTASFGEDEDYNQADATGFINLFGLSIKERAKLSKNWPEVK